MWASRLLLLAGACVVTTSAVPTSIESDSMTQLTEAVLAVVNADQSLRQQLADTLAAVKTSQTGIKEFLEVAARTNNDDLARAVGEALGNAGVATGGVSLGNLTAEIRSLNQLFRTYLRKMSCTSPFRLVGQECFSFILEDMTWEGARQKCLELGADLASPRDITELRLYVGSRYPRKSRRNFWIGGWSQNKDWQWLSGDPIDDRYWYTNEPSGNGECLAMFDGWENPFTDFPCDNERRAICQLNLGKVEGNN